MHYTGMPFFRLLSEFFSFLFFSPPPPPFFRACIVCVTTMRVNWWLSGQFWLRKSSSFKGASPPSTPTGVLPLDPAGGSAPRPPITRYFPTFLNSPSGIPDYKLHKALISFREKIKSLFFILFFKYFFIIYLIIIIIIIVFFFLGGGGGATFHITLPISAILDKLNI